MVYATARVSSITSSSGAWAKQSSKTTLDRYDSASKVTNQIKIASKEKHFKLCNIPKQYVVKDTQLYGHTDKGRKQRNTTG